MPSGLVGAAAAECHAVNNAHCLIILGCCNNGIDCGFRNKQLFLMIPDTGSLHGAGVVGFLVFPLPGLPTAIFSLCPQVEEREGKQALCPSEGH